MISRCNLLVHVMVLMLAVSCATSRKSGFEVTDGQTTLSDAEYKAIEKAAKDNWARRDERASLEASLAAWEKIANSSSVTLESLTKLTHGWYLLADGHESDIEKKKAFWEKGAAFGEKAMATNPAFKKAVTEDKKEVKEALALLGKAEAPAMYWTAANLGKWARATGIASTLKYKPLITELVKTVERVDGQYFHGAIPRYWGGYFAVAPSFAGGDMDKSWKSFQKSLSLAPNYLGTKVLIAELWYVKKGDRKSFEKILNEVINTKDDIQADLKPENILEKRKAQKLLSSADELF